VMDFRGRTLRALDEFLSGLESQHANLLYLRDEELCELVQNGFCKTEQGNVRVNVTKKRFTKARVRKRIG